MKGHPFSAQKCDATLCPFQSSKRKQIFPDLGYFKAGWPLSLIHLIKSNFNNPINVRITRTWLPFDNCNFPFSATLISLWSDSNLSLESKVASLAYYYPHVQGAPIPLNNHVPTPHPRHLHQPPTQANPSATRATYWSTRATLTDGNYTESIQRQHLENIHGVTFPVSKSPSFSDRDRALCRLICSPPSHNTHKQ